MTARTRRGAAKLAGCEHKTVAHWAAQRELAAGTAQVAERKTLSIDSVVNVGTDPAHPASCWGGQARRLLAVLDWGGAAVLVRAGESRYMAKGGSRFAVDGLECWEVVDEYRGTVAERRCGVSRVLGIQTKLHRWAVDDGAAACHGVVPGSVLIPRTVLEWRIALDSQWRNPHLVGGLDQRLILVCDHGYSSILAASSLVQFGFNRTGDVIGGFEMWKHEGLPVAPVRTAPIPPGTLPGLEPPQ